MTSIFLSACVLAFLTMAVHATGIAVLLRGFMRARLLQPRGVWPVSRLLLRMIWWLILLHVAEISIWGRLLPVARMHAQCRGSVLLFQGHVHHPWLWRPGAGETVAAARTD
jgi:hypothetical protein